MKKIARTAFMLMWLLMVFVIGCSQQPMACETIHEAAFAGNLADVKRHLRKGAIVNVRDELGKTPLFWAAANGRLDVVKFLVAKGAIVNARDKNNETPLMEATHEGHRNVAEFLKQHGAKE